MDVHVAKPLSTKWSVFCLRLISSYFTEVQHVECCECLPEGQHMSEARQPGHEKAKLAWHSFLIFPCVGMVFVVVIVLSSIQGRGGKIRRRQ